MRRTIFLLILILVFIADGYGQSDPVPVESQDTLETNSEDQEPRKWYEEINIKGYVQARHNQVLESSSEVSCDECDPSWVKDDGTFIRRARVVFSGDVHENVFFYVQPEFATGTENLAQLKDAYMDVALDDEKEFRFRIGLSKIPYSFENLQSSSNRVPLDRNDGTNSSFESERDAGIMFYWTPRHIQERLSWLKSAGLKGTGNYGLLGIGAFNGQDAHSPDLNDEPHVIARLSYPFQFKNGQVVEATIQGYYGEYVVNSDLVEDLSFYESRIAGSIVYYPQPFGFQAEYNIGHGPEFDRETMTVEDKPLHGGYAQAMYYLELGTQVLVPFARWQIYEGGVKYEQDATSHRVNEQEFGIEWQANSNFELTVMYTVADRRFENSIHPINRQTGSVLSIQAQVRY